MLLGLAVSFTGTPMTQAHPLSQTLGSGEDEYQTYTASNFETVPTDWAKYEYGANASTSAKVVDNRLVIATSAGGAQSATQHFGGVYIVDAERDWQDFTLEMTFSVESVYEGAWRWLGILYHAQEATGVTQIYDSETESYTPVDPAVNTLTGYTLVARASKGQIFQSSINAERKTTNGTAVSSPVLYDGTATDHTITLQVSGNTAKYYVDGTKYVEFDTTTQDSNLGSHHDSGKIAIITSTLRVNIKSLYITSEVRDDISKSTPNISFTAGGSAFTNGTHLSEGSVTPIEVTTDVNTPSYSVYYTKDDGATNLGSEAPTEAGTYAINVKVKEHVYNVAASAFRWYIIDQVSEKITPTVEFSNVTSFEYDHEQHTPTITFKVDGVEVSDVEYALHYESNGNVTYEAPTEIGWYSVVVEVTENDKYASLKTWKVFNIYDSANAFARDWAKLRVDGGETGICGYLTEATRGDLDALIARYDALSTDDKNALAETIDVEDATIAQSVEYARSLLLTLDGNETESSANPLAVNSQINNILIITLSVCAMCLVAYIFINRKKLCK